MMATANRKLLVVLGILVLIVLVGPVVGWGLGGWGMMGPGMLGGYWSGGAQAGGWGWALAMWLGVLSMLAFWGALIVGVVLLVRWLGGTAGRAEGAGTESALDILRRRYAAGELSAEEYERMRQVLER
ncbi:MAG: SHOCT domain-containing protein [Chloroflexi bacterium]|nr:SHOCT domain-containing protein [Chloroflexota bacterium]